MEPRAFDHIARLLGAARTRRAGLKTVLAVALGASAAQPAAEAARRGIPEGGPWPAGPCGPKGKDNLCKKDEQCCTGFCKKGKKGKAGRCRCIKPGNPCGKNQSCCKHATCEDGTCTRGKKTIPTGQPCTSADTCADTDATCQEYDSETPAGTYCLLPTGGACSGDSDCFSQDCASGACAAVACDVCLSGCPFTTIAGALASLPADGRIRVAPGTWTGVENPSADVQIEACGGAPGVLIVPDTSSCISVQGGRSVRLKNLEFSWNGSQTAYTMLASVGDSAAAMAVVDVKGCTFTSAIAELAIYFYTYTTVTITDCTFDNAGIYAGTDTSKPAGDPSTFTMTNSTVTMKGSGYAAAFDGEITVVIRDSILSGGALGVGGGIYFSASGPYAYAYAGSLTLAGSTVVTGNTASDGGGGVGLAAQQGSSIAFVMADTSVITTNSAPNGSGLIAVLGKSGTATGSVTVSGAGTRVKDNTGAPSQCAKSLDDQATWTVVADCTTF